ncbi:DUF1572 family protein [Urechidicola croceus]|uniref:DUF1572 domain-containing protein n=1 Tax=Urechidicola croceus TaxID=1850246 RepID=A0A1D8P617_9FLAO|nr:DUF1572 family protein [Urechidicola croceus]AOW20009.1 hypothetical protein LPB138_04620 [Urechidicola croceus]
MKSNYLNSVKRQFEYYKSLGDKTFQQLNENDIHWQFNSESNSIAIIVKHIVGNMLSRWTNFRTEDGEKTWRHRDTEFENTYKTKLEMLQAWEKGWKCLFDAILPLENDDLNELVYIRNQGHSIDEAINRQLCHYPYHIGQIVYIGKMLKDEKWKTLSIAKNKSSDYNKDKFSKEKSKKHFTDDV